MFENGLCNIFEEDDGGNDYTNYNGDAEHDGWVDYLYHIKTGDLPEYSARLRKIPRLGPKA